MLRSLVLFTALAFLLAVQPFDANAALGDVDQTFGTAGFATDNVNGHIPRSVTLQQDGKILVTGYRTTQSGDQRFFLRRYLSNGSLDTAFGTNGAAENPDPFVFNTDYRGFAIVIKSNGKIAVIGLKNDQPAVWQFNSNGTADTTFDNDGFKVMTHYGYTYYGEPQISIQEGKLLLSVAKDMGPAFKLALVRLNGNGTVDTTFGAGGESLTNFNAENHYRATVVDTDGKITVGGYRYHNQSIKGFERKLANGQPDTSFTPPLNNSQGAVATRMIRMANGKYAMTQLNFDYGSSTPIPFLEKYSAEGIFESNIEPFLPPSNPNCPQVFANQKAGRVMITFGGILFRMNNELDPASLETTICPDLAGRYAVTEAAVRSDDKIVAAGIYNGSMFLTRLLAY